MRRLELSTELPASAEAAWEALIDTSGWPRWGRLVVSAEGEFEAGSRWTMQLRGGPGPRTMRPYFVSMGAPREIVFETRLGGGAVRMQHAFEVEARGGGSVLHQRFEATGPAVPLLWRWLRAGMLQFDQLGDDLAAQLSSSEPASQASSSA
ncbi:MAG: hypothetical protein GY898_32780 [Proteobacteria bacterium]|nr:hypothetical protein [Pseudomonadota bacterium]